MNLPLRVLCVLLLSLLAATCGCESSGNGRDAHGGGTGPPAPFVSREGPPVLAGTAIDAASGRPLAGVILTLPDGTSGVSDANGRFELTGMPIGLAGMLVARHESGLEGHNKLLPLAGGRLEIVVRLRRVRDR
jgi:hypothetical protein